MTPYCILERIRLILQRLVEITNKTCAHSYFENEQQNVRHRSDSRGSLQVYKTGTLTN